MPRRASWSGRMRVTSAPAKVIAPPSARKWPEIRLISVVFPAPFGPISPNTMPWGTARSTAFTATTPPNRFVRPTVSSNIRSPHLAETRGAADVEQRHQAARQVHDDHDEDRALQDVAIFLERLERRRQRRQERGPEDRAEHVRDAARDREHQDLHRAREAVLVRLEREVEGPGQAPGPPPLQRTPAQRRQLVAAHR